MAIENQPSVATANRFSARSGAMLLLSISCCVSLWPLAASSAPFLTLPNGEKVFSTGKDDVGATLANGGIDPHYPLTLSPPTGAQGLFVVDPPPSFLSVNSSDSVWLEIGGFGDHGVALGTFEVQTSIDLSSVDVSTLEIRGFWVSDNFGRDILVNGSSTGQANNGQHEFAPSAFPDNAFMISAASGLVSGVNIITFQWHNVGYTPGDPTLNPAAVRVEFTEIDFIPAPASIPVLSVWGTLLLGSGLLALAAARRRAL